MELVHGRGRSDGAVVHMQIETPDGAIAVPSADAQRRTGIRPYWIMGRHCPPHSSGRDLTDEEIEKYVRPKVREAAAAWANNVAPSA